MFRSFPSAPISSRTWSRHRSDICLSTPAIGEPLFNESFLKDSRNWLPDLLPDFAYLADTVRVIDVADAAPGMVLQILMNGELDEALAVLDGTVPGAAGNAASERSRRCRNPSATRTGAGACRAWSAWRNSWTRPLRREGDVSVRKHEKCDGRPPERHRSADPLHRDPGSEQGTADLARGLEHVPGPSELFEDRIQVRRTAQTSTWSPTRTSKTAPAMR